MIDIKASSPDLEPMRTTLTIEDDLARQLQQLSRERDEPFKRVVNEALRRGLDQMRRAEEPSVPYRTIPWSVGRCLLPDLDDIAGVLARVEGEAYR
jgi:hypothetical protein